MRLDCVPKLCGAALLCLVGGVTLSGCSNSAATGERVSETAGETPSRPAGPSTQLSAGLPAPRRQAERVPSPGAKEETEGAASVGLRFVDVHEEAGLNFVLDNGHSRARLMVESTVGGAGWLDYDGDGWWDLFLPQGGNPFTEGVERRTSNDELFRNLDGVRFARVTEQAGIRDADFGHGVSVGDFDDDGFDDVYVCNVGPDRLYHNCGDGTFQEISAAAGIDNPVWSSSAAWGDLDADGDLDLYVCNYLDYDPWHPIACLSQDGQPGICHPEEVDAVLNKCYLNQGDGTFRNIADERGLNGPDGKSLGVVIADLNGDRRPDVYVANDTTANHLFVNLGDGRYEERAIALGCAISGQGHYQASMGIGFGDYDENGYPDLYCTHFTKDSNTLYANYGPAGFEDTTRKTDLHLPTLNYLAFGTVMADFDYNGRQDLFVANGHIDDWRKRSGDLWYMPPQLFTFNGMKWTECGKSAGGYFEKEWLGRAVASADYDDDGDLDLLVAHQNAAAGLLRNDSARGRFLKLRFLGTESNRRGVGVQVTVTQGRRRLVQQLAGGTSYCAAHQPILCFGLGTSAEPCRITVEWPQGRRQELVDVAVDQSLVLRESDAQEP
uniref:CRTAC1 family protein n=1 Tax=Schlesneria paludicola TaxID=360056 RepID=A0A7C2P3W5_9PLAN